MDRNASIDGLRGVCAVCLVIFHMTVRYSALYLDDVFSDFLFVNRWGDIFSSVFLMISSYFLYAPYKNQFEFWKYLKNKFWRLWPLYFLAVTFIFVITRFYYLPDRTGELKDYFFNIIMLNGYIGTLYIDGSHWYMTTLLSAIIIIGILRYYKVDDQPVSYLIWMIAAFLINCLATLTDNTSRDVIYGIGKVLCNPYVGVICVGIGFHKGINDMKNNKALLGRGWLTMICLGFCISLLLLGVWRTIGMIVGMIALSVCIYFPKSLLSLKIFVALGSISYPVYLVHQNIGYLIQNQLILKTGYYNRAYAVVAIVATIICGLMLNILEKNLRKFIAKRDC